MRSYSFDISKSNGGEGYTIDTYKTLHKASINRLFAIKVFSYSIKY